MTALPTLLPYAAALLALLAAALLLWLDRGVAPRLWAMLPLAVLAPLAAVIGLGAAAPPATAPLAACLVIALLSRARDDVLHSEIALKLLWVFATAFALSWAGRHLLVVVSGSSRAAEQWTALALGLDSPMLWSAAIPLGLLAGLVLLGGAPFHFWAADLLQGSRAWLGPIVVAALQTCGAAWLTHGLVGIEAFPDGAAVASGLLGVTAGTAFVVGGLTLLWQRRPERRVGTLASLHAGLALATIVATRGGPIAAPPGALAAWSAHLALALTGAAALARLVPVPGRGTAPPAPVFKRHPLAGLAGLYALASLAGVPGTPGAMIWLDAAQRLASAGRVALLLSLGFAWVAAFTSAARQVREAFGVPETRDVALNPVPAGVRAALWIAGAGLVLAGVVRVLPGLRAP